MDLLKDLILRFLCFYETVSNGLERFGTVQIALERRRFLNFQAYFISHPPVHYNTKKPKLT